MPRQAKSAHGGDRISVFQQDGAAVNKIRGISEYGRGISIVEVLDFATDLPEFIDDPAPYFPERIQGNIVLSFLKHPDLADFAGHYCRDQGVVMVASGPRKIAGGHSPFTCCGLADHALLGSYGRQFGIPGYRVTLQEKRISAVTVERGASCGATWLALPRLLGCTPDEALEKVAREVQFHCQANPAAFDPISGHSPLHFAGNIHYKALEKALRDAS